MGWRDWNGRVSPPMVWSWQFALSRAFQETGSRVESRHLLWALSMPGPGVGKRVLRGLGVDIEALDEEVRSAAWVPRPGVPGDPLNLDPLAEALEVPARFQVAPDTDAVLDLAAEEATDHLGTAHLLLGLLRHGTPELSARGVTVDVARAEIGRQMTEFLSGRVPPMDPIRADELISSPRERLPDDIRELIARIENLRGEKEEAIDAKDYPRAEHAVEELKDAYRRKAQRVAEWAPKVDVASVVAEVELLRAEVDRLRNR